MSLSCSGTLLHSSQPPTDRRLAFFQRPSSRWRTHYDIQQFLPLECQSRLTSPWSIDELLSSIGCSVLDLCKWRRANQVHVSLSIRPSRPRLARSSLRRQFEVCLMKNNCAGVGLPTDGENGRLHCQACPIISVVSDQ